MRKTLVESWLFCCFNVYVILFLYVHGSYVGTTQGVSSVRHILENTPTRTMSKTLKAMFKTGHKLLIC